MSNLQVEWSESELLETDPIAEPLVVAGRHCHGGFDATGGYRSPRTRFRVPAIEAWQAAHREQFGTEMLGVPLDTWPRSYPNVAQAKLLLRAGVREPTITSLTRIGTVEGFGALIRHATVADPQRFFVESIEGTAIAHLHRGLFEAHAHDEAGWEDEAGHKEMWFAAHDVAFESPPTEDITARMYERMGISPGGAAAAGPEEARRRLLELRVFDDLDPGFEALIRRMISILLIEISAFHVFAWAEEVLSDSELVAGDGEAARVVSFIRQDETPHVEYLKTALTEMRDRTIIGESGRQIAGTGVIGHLWDRMLAQSLGETREANLRTSVAEVESALANDARGPALLEEFHALGDWRPEREGALA